MLLPRTVAFVFRQMLLPFLFEVVIPHLLADVGPILLNNVLDDVLAKICGTYRYKCDRVDCDHEYIGESA